MLGFQLALGEEAMTAKGRRVPFMLALPRGVLELVSSRQARGHPLVFQDLEESSNVPVR